MRSTILKASVALSMAVLCLSRKSPRIVLVAATLFAVVCLVYVSELRIRKLAASYVLGPERISEQSSPATATSVQLGLPVDYQNTPAKGDHCADVYGLPYLENLRDSNRPYCQPDSSRSSLDCFNMVIGNRQDVFCVAESEFPHQSSFVKPFNIGCKLRDWSQAPDLEKAPTIQSFPRYMYDTGPGFILSNFVSIDSDKVSPEEAKPPSVNCTKGVGRGYKILIKREGEGNPWHTLLEIFSLYLTLDILSMTPKPNSTSTLSEPYYTKDRAKESQVVILDDRKDGPFFELWSLFTGQPTIRLADLPPTPCEYDIIVPLPGGSNPLWLSDWHPQNCEDSVLTSTFSKRLLGHYSIPTLRRHDEKLTITIIDRKTTRVLKGLDSHVALLEEKYKDKDVKVQAVDFASLSFKQQLEVVQDTDVLVGVHGAGMVHIMFMHPGSAAVEIFPAELTYPVYRNLAKLSNVQYFGAHGTRVLRKARSDIVERAVSFSAGDGRARHAAKRGDWHGEDIQIAEKEFLEIVDLALRSTFNRGTLNIDVV